MALIQYSGVEILRQEHVVLKDVNLHIADGEFTYIIGKVGCGKSSLLKSMYCEVPIEAGSAEVLDYDLTKIRRRDIPMLRRQIGIVFQDFQLLFDRTVSENLAFVLKATGWDNKSEREERIDQVLTQVGMLNKSYKMPHELSGGEQQRIVIARALLNRPKLILADEPTGNLDPASGETVVNYLQEISRAGTAVVMATHNLSLVQQFPGRVLDCNNKHITEIVSLKQEIISHNENIESKE